MMIGMISTMLRILTRQFLGEWLRLGLSILTLVTLGLLAFQGLRIAPVLSGTGFNVSILLESLGNILPSFLTAAIPMAMFAALMGVFGRQVRDGEWSSLQGAGVGRQRYLLPVFVLAGLLSLLLLFVTHEAAPRGLERLETTIRRSGLEILMGRVQPGRYIDLSNGLTLFVRRQNAPGDWGEFLLALEGRSPRRVLWAEKARLARKGGSGFLLLENGGMEESAPTSSLADGSPSGGPVSVRFDKLRIDPGRLLPRETARLFSPEQRRRSLDLTARLPDEEDGETRLRGRVEIQRRFATALAPLLLGFLAVGLAGRSWLARSSTAYAVSAGVLLVYYLLERLGIGLGLKLQILWPGPWLPFPVLILLAVRAFRRSGGR